MSDDVLDDILGGDDLDDDLDDDLEDELEADEMEDGGDQLADDDALSEELGVDYAVSDHDVQALSGERGATLMQPKILGSAVRLNPADELARKIAGGAEIKCIVVHFTNGRKLYVTP